MIVHNVISKSIQLRNLYYLSHQLYTTSKMQQSTRLHGWCHIGRVLNNIDIILNDISEPIKVKILLAAALTHDIGYFSHPDDHVRASAIDCDNVLKESGFRLEEVEAIRLIILAHSPKVRQPVDLEDYILYIADKCDMLGYDGLMRVIMESGFLYENRDEFAQNLLSESLMLTQQLRLSPVGQNLIEQRWLETSHFLETILVRTPHFWKDGK
jgi:HD superfamily phosphodiesterase